MLLACAIHHQKAHIEEILVSKYSHFFFKNYYLKDFCTFLLFLALTFEPKMLES